MNNTKILHKFSIAIALCTIIMSSGCATKEVRESATWLGVVTNKINDKATEYKKQRDALAQARQIGICSLEASALDLEQSNQKTMFYWTIPSKSKNQAKTLLKQLLDESKTMEAQLESWKQLQQEHEKRIKEAKSSIALTDKKLTESSKYLAELGKSPKLRDQLDFYADFFAEVKKSLEENEEQTQKNNEQGIADTESKTEEQIKGADEAMTSEDSKDQGENNAKPISKFIINNS